MCVIFFYVNSNPEKDGYKLILASNRDEFYARDTKEVSQWDGVDNCYGGIDMEPGREGGTWLAISGKDGIFKIAALLNLTGEPKPRNAVDSSISSHHPPNQTQQKSCNFSSNKTSTTTTNGYKSSTNNYNSITTATQTNSDEFNHHHIQEQLTTPTLHHNNNSLLGRGMLVTDYVRNFGEKFDNVNYNQRLVEDCSKYSAFNFVSIEIGSPTVPALVTLCSNVPPGLVHYKENSCYGFGNSLPSAPFEKVRYGRNRFEQIIDSQPQQTELVDELMSLLKCKEKFWPDAELKRRAPNWGEYLSALNVYVPDCGYGSRTHTVILIDANNKMHFIEETMRSQDPNGEWCRNHIEKQFPF
ncbi:transport and golgi organization 2 isoform X1 [Musca autumnalis]|uniref:transport and golgi organization 2 isoform X1 n=1 Tax=Musca autumnalis TaxID=221902 RepID=UPI003CF4C423